MKILNSFLLGSVLIISYVNTNGQTYADTIQAYKFDELSEKYSNEGSLDSSTIYLRKAAKIFKSLAESQQDTLMWCEYLWCLDNIATNLTDGCRFNDSKNTLDTALTISLKVFGENHQQTASIYYHFGDMYHNDDKYDISLEYLFKESEIYKKMISPDKIYIANNNYLIGRDYLFKGEQKKALEFTNKCINIYKEKPVQFKLDMARAYNQMAFIFLQKSEFDKALEYYQTVLAIYIDTLGEKNLRVATVYNDRGTAYGLSSEYNKSLESFLKSLEIRKDLVIKEDIDFATSYNNIGIAYLEKKEYDKALEYTLKSLKIKTDLLGEKHAKVCSSLMSLGDIYMEEKKYTTALEYYQKTFDILSQLFGRKNPGAVPAYDCLALAYSRLSDNSKALLYYQKGIACFFPNFIDSIHPYSLPPIRYDSGIIDDSGWYSILYLIRNKAIILSDTTRSLKAIGTLTNLDRQQVAIQHFMACDQIIDMVRKNMGKLSDKMALGMEANFIYEGAVGVCLNLAASVQQSEAAKYNQLAFYYSEKGKSAVLLEALAGQEAQKFAGIPEPLLEAEHKLQTDIAFYTKKLAGSENLDSVKIGTYQQQLFKCNRSYDSLIVVFEKKYPKYHELKYNVNTASVKDVQQLIDKKTAMLSYFVGDSTVTTYTITKNSYNVVSAKKPVNLEKSIAYFRNSLTRTNKQSELAYKKYGNNLYEMLFPKVMDKNIDNLIIVPDGVLATIPFEALLTSKAADTTMFQNLPYLVRKYSISYCSSATLFKETFSKTKGDPKEIRPLNDWIAYAPVFDDENPQGTSLASRALISELRKINKDSTLTRGLMMGSGEVVPPLPGSEKEVKNIFDEFDKLNLKTTVELKGNASERNIKSGELENYKYIHLATHGFVNSEKPELSGILLAQVPDSTNEQNDGILYSGEIFNLKLNADLVVLSACETGLGQIKKGEGIIGLTRALLYAGAKNLMVSLWQVSDQSTSDLMISFYKNLLNEKSARLSNPVRFAPLLQQAKLKMIGEAKFAHPYYWSPFIMIGQ